MSNPFSSSPSLAVDFGPLKLRNPLVALSGTFGYGEEYAGLVDISSVGAVITKTVTVEPREGNPPPRLWETSCGLLNSIGLANVGLREFLRCKLPAILDYDTLVIVNLAGVSPREFAVLAREVGSAGGVAALELNLSCPNVKEGGIVLSANPAMTEEAVRAAVSATNLPVIAKLSPNVADMREAARAAARAGAAGISMINTLVGMSVNVETRRSRLGTDTGGLSGPAIKPVALARVWQVVEAVDLPVMGMGGVTSAGDALEFLTVGATAVGVGTATFRNPRTMQEIAEGISVFLREQGMGSVRELIGSYVPCDGSGRAG